MLRHKIDMLTVLIIGNSTTTLCAGAMVTPRGYKL
jgi:precorrin-3B methylase